jgi:hypothetical protein
MTVRNAFKFVVVLALVFAVAGGYGVFTAKANSNSANAVSKLDLNAPHSVSGKEALQFQRFVSGNAGGLSIPAGDVATLIDGLSMKCAGPGTCTYTADEWLQVVSSTGTTNWAVAGFLDGTVMTGEGPYQGVIGTDFASGSWSERSASVGAGTHSVQTYAYSRDQNAGAYNYNFNYRVFKP